jgi:hypothetical protein
MNKKYFSMKFIKICTDLIALEPINIILPSIPGEEIQDVQQKFNYLYQQV